jgi:phosphatidylglycerol---prolipoprotein diacylglyceryl transferase
MFPTLINLGFIRIPTYGVMLVTGIVVALFLAQRRANKAGLPGNKIADLGFWVVLWGLLGAKIMLVITEPSYLSSLSGLWWLLRSGGVFYGGLIGALAAAAVLLVRYRLPFLPVADVLVPSVALGHFFGRLGCFSAGCCYGKACSLPIGVTFSNPLAHEVSGTPLGVPLYPTQLFEAVFNFFNWIFLAWLFRRHLRPGTVLAAYLIGYGTARFIIEFYRGDADRGFVFGGALSTSQAIAAVMVPLGIGILIWTALRHKRSRVKSEE